MSRIIRRTITITITETWTIVWTDGDDSFAVSTHGERTEADTSVGRTPCHTEERTPDSMSTHITRLGSSPVIWFLAALLILFSATPLFAAPQDNVIGTGAPASCTGASLATAIAAGGLITFDCGPNPTTIAGGPYTVSGDVSIDGAGLITLDGQSAHRLFVVNAGANLALANLTLVNGYVSGSGGAIFNQGTLNLDSVTIRDSEASGPSVGGGAIFNNGGTLYLFGSKLLGNQATAIGGAISSYLGTTTVENSLIEDNSADSIGGIDSVGELFVRNSTLRDNRG